LKSWEEYIKIKKMRQMSKKIIFIFFFLLFSITFLYAANSKNITLSIQGSGSQDFVESFKYALKVEANAAGYQITDDVNQSKYSIKFTVEYDRREQRSKFVVSLIKVEDSSVIITMEYFFADEEEMLLYSQLVFFLLMSNLPEDVTTVAVEDDSWRNKWLYFNLSFDYSFMCLLLKEIQLDDGTTAPGNGSGMWRGPDDNPDMIAPLDHKIVPMPGISFGIEFQFLSFMSIEPHAHISIEHAISGHLIYSALFSARLKFPLKFFKSIVITPYGVVAYPMRFMEDEDTEIFDFDPDEDLKFIFGGGIQIAAKLGNSGGLFFDISFLYVGDTFMKNFYSELYPKPEKIPYNQFILGFSIGYKFGLFNRKR